MTAVDIIFALCLGIGLAAACGFRVFVPLFIISLAQAGGYVQLAQGMQWLGSPAAMVALGFATALEIGGYYVPWLDNLLDTVATPAAVVAGTFASASVITGMDPMLQWVIATILGGGTAGVVQVGTVVSRGVSTATTGGTANSAVSTTEAAAATTMSLLAIILPIVAGVLVLLVAGLMVYWMVRRIKRRRVARIERVTTAQPDELIASTSATPAATGAV